MPIYSYECKKHGEFEVVQSMSKATDEYKCPECDKVSKRVWQVQNHVWSGFDHPSINANTQRIRVKNNTKIYGEKMARYWESKVKL